MTMTVEQVRELMGGYTAAKGRAARLEAETGKIRAELSAMRAASVTTLKAQVIDDMPRRKGGVSDPVGVKAVQLADGQPLSKEEKKLTERLNEKQAALDQLKLEMSLVEGWLGALFDRERLVVESQCIRKESWNRTAEQYLECFGDNVSEDTLRRMRDRTLTFIATQM